jgi:antitoxin (DNA-binding transcriptional repressor) of toxin-antitoxin stability system
VEKTGNPVTICRNNHPIVDIVPHRNVNDLLEPSPHLQGARFHGDPCAPVSAEDWPEAAR